MAASAVPSNREQRRSVAARRGHSAKERHEGIEARFMCRAHGRTRWRHPSRIASAATLLCSRAGSRTRPASGFTGVGVPAARHARRKPSRKIITSLVREQAARGRKTVPLYRRRPPDGPRHRAATRRLVENWGSASLCRDPLAGSTLAGARRSDAHNEGKAGSSDPLAGRKNTKSVYAEEVSRALSPLARKRGP